METETGVETRLTVRPLPIRTQPLSESPILNVTPDAWEQYRHRMADVANAHRVSDTGHIGLYRFGIPRLAEIGLMANPQKEGRNWRAAWIPWLTLEGLLGSIRAQTEVFRLSTGDHTFDIQKTSSLVGRSAEGQRTTLSGLLAVAHRAGFRGLQSWLVRADDRKRFPNTTAAFRAANGLF